MFFVLPILVSVVLSFFLTRLAASFAQKRGLVDYPAPRKVHQSPLPRLGGVAIALTFFTIAIAHKFIYPEIFAQIPESRFWGAVLGSLILVLAGIWDDILGLSPFKKLLFQILAALTVVSFGIGIDYLRTPFGNVFYFSPLFSKFFTIFWIVFLVNVVNFLDGLDGLAAGFSTIAFSVLFFLAINPPVLQPATALLALILASSSFGFLFLNFHPAKIFMGDSGSMFLGYWLAIISLISGGKIAASFLVLAIPIFDAFWVILRRIFLRKSPFLADKKHLHHRLLSIGLPQGAAVWILWLLAAISGIVALQGGTPQEKLRSGIYTLIFSFALAVTLVVLEYVKTNAKFKSQN